jgi:F-type H+-transporting ATPase subunit gamma
MANLKEIRIRLNSVKSTRQITSAMKMVSAAKLRRAQESVLQLRPFFTKLHDIMQFVSASIEDDHENLFSHPLESSRVLMVMITSNRGLCGAFNSNIVKKTIQSIHEQYYDAFRNGNVEIISIGKKGADMLRSKNIKVVATFHELLEKPRFEDASGIANRFMENFKNGKYGIVKLFYNRFRNAAVQEITEEFLLPVMPEKEHEDRYESHYEYIFEPSNTGILDEMIPYSLRVQFFRALLESNASEHGARMTAMHKATDNATEFIKELELNYNKARQAAITKEILEIVSGAEALKS